MMSDLPSASESPSVASPAVSSVLYLHGFNSAGASPKAQLIKNVCARLAAASGKPLDCLTPDLSHQPAVALEQAEQQLAWLSQQRRARESRAREGRDRESEDRENEIREEEKGAGQTLLIGSSMGGFLATCLAERHALRAVLINPAVAPARFVADYLGASLTNAYTGEVFTVGQTHHDELAAMDWAPLVHPERYLLLLGSADETLDCRDALKAYAGARTLIEPGGDHGFSRLAHYLPAIFAHGGWTLSADGN